MARLAAIACALVAACSGGTSNPAAPAKTLELAAPTPSPTGSGSGSAAWTTLIAVTPEHLVRVFPDTPLEHQDFMAGKPQYEWHLMDRRVVDGTGTAISMCRGDDVVVDGRVVAKLTADGFTSDTLRVTIAGDGLALFVRGADKQTLRYTRDIDPCSAALMYFMIPVPRAG